jgi:large subunit ribosomal protein L19
MSDLIRRVTWDRIKGKKNLPDFQSGDTVGVYVKVKEGEKERVQLFSGVVLKVQGSGPSRSFTVRKIASGVGVERTFPMLSPIIDRVELISRGKIRRSRLFFLRGLKGRSARLDSEVYFGEGAAPGAADEVQTEVPTPEAAAGSAQAEAPKAEKKPKQKEAKQTPNKKDKA